MRLRILFLSFAFMACGQDLGRKKKDREPLTPISVDPIEEPVPQPSPTPTPTPEPQPTPVPTPQPTPIPTPTPTPTPKPDTPETVWMNRTWGRWVGSCTVNQDKTSWMPGIEIKKDHFVFLTFYYPNKQDCTGAASPNDGDPRFYDLELLRKKTDDGWFILRGRCQDSKCAGTKFIMVKNDKSLYVREVKDENASDGYTTIYPNGPSR